MGVGGIVGRTRGQVDNENNSQVNIRTYWIYYKVGVYIYECESIAIRNRNIMDYGLEHRKWCVQQGKHRNAISEHGIGTGKIRNRNGTGTKLEMVILRMVLWYLSSSVEYPGNLGSQCEAVIAVLPGLMSSEVELVQGVWQGCDRFRTGQGCSAKSCESYGM